jgi:hypothetical protein
MVQAVKSKKLPTSYISEIFDIAGLGRFLKRERYATVTWWAIIFGLENLPNERPLTCHVADQPGRRR